MWGQRRLYDDVFAYANSLYQRMLNKGTLFWHEYEWVQNTAIIATILKENEIPDYENVAYDMKVPNFTLTFSIEGIINPAISVPLNHKYLYPKYKQLVGKKEYTLRPDVQAFLNRQKDIILISFGTKFSPRDFEMRAIIDFILQNP